MAKLKLLTTIIAALAAGVILGGDSVAQNSACLSTSGPSEHHPWGRPDGTSAKNQLVVHHDYEVSMNAATKFADWTAYRLDDGSTVSGRSRNYRLDPCLDSDEQISDGEYEGAHSQYGYDRGHLAPLATFSDSNYWQEVNFMSNITPMHQTLNRGVWAQLEAAIRSLASSEKTVYVTTGTIYAEEMPEIPNAMKAHRVPSHYFKIVATGNADDPDNFDAVGFLFDQFGCVVNESCTFNSQFEDNIVSIDEIERLSAEDAVATDLDFFPKLTDEVESELEETPGTWPPGPANGPPADVVIDSMLPNPSGSEPDNEWIKLCNRGSEDADIGGWTLSDGEGTYTIPSGTTLKAGECLKIPGDEYNPTGDTQDLFLANSGEEVVLRDAGGSEADSCRYSNAGSDEVINCN